MWKGIVKKEMIRKVATYDEDFVSKHVAPFRVYDFYLYVNVPEDIETFNEEAILKWTGSIEVYPSGFGALSSSSKELELKLEYKKEGDDSKEKTKEITFTGNFEDEGRGNPDEVEVDVDFSDFDNPKITKVRVDYEGRFNE